MLNQTLLALFWIFLLLFLPSRRGVLKCWKQNVFTQVKRGFSTGKVEFKTQRKRHKKHKLCQRIFVFYLGNHEFSFTH